MADAKDAGVDETVEGAVDKTGVEAEDSGAPQDQQDETEKAVLEAELEKVKLERDNYKIALDQKRQLRKPPQEVVPADDEAEDAPVTRKDLKEVVDVIQGSQASAKVETMLNTLVKDPKKREIVKHYYETRFSQMGTSDAAIQSGLTDALDLVDSKINKKRVEELARKNMQEHQAPLSGSDADRGAPSKTHKFSADQVKVLTERAKAMNADPAKFIEQAWKNQNRG